MSEDNKVQKTVESVEGERSLPSVNTARRSKNNTLAIAFVLFALVVTGGYGYFSFFSGSRKPPKVVPPVVVKPQNERFTMPIDFDIPADPLPVTQAPPEEPVKKPKADKIAKKPAAPKILIDHSSSSLMVSTQKSKAKDTSGNQGGQGSDARKPAGPSKQTALGSRLTTTQSDVVGATHILNRNFFLSKGTVIDCSLQTRIDSSLPGYVSCVTTRDIYSDSGTVLLLERGSQVLGEYQGQVDNGVTKLFIVWGRVKTPNGIVVNIDSPAADSLGAAGADGYVKSRFWKRFGAAMLLSIIDEAYSTATDLAKINMANRTSNNNKKKSMDTGEFQEMMMMQIQAQKMQLEQARQWEAAGLDIKDMPKLDLTSAYQNNNSSYNENEKDGVNFDIGSSTSPFRDIISHVLSKQASIPDIFTKNQGEKITIFVARDLDFSEVYDVNAE